MTLEEIIINVPLYKEYKFNIIKEQNFQSLNEEGKDFFYALLNVKKCDLLCIQCNKIYPFDVVNMICIMDADGNAETNYESNIFIGSTPSPLGLLPLKLSDISKKKFTKFQITKGVIEQYLYCNKHPEEHIYVVYYKFSIIDGEYISIMKIGQDVPNFMLTNNLSNIYRKELNKYDAFDDFRMYEQSISRGLKAGACTYLRRVFEKMVTCKYIEQNGENDNKHFDEKIKLIINEFAEEIRDMLRNTYSLLSKGIHELKENDIDNFIKSVSEVILIQLDYEKELREKKERRGKLLSSINKSIEKYHN